MPLVYVPCACAHGDVQSRKGTIKNTSRSLYIGPIPVRVPRSGANCDRRDIGGSREPMALAMRPANPGAVFPTVEHLREIAMRLFMGSLVGIGGLRPFRFQVILPYPSVLTPISRNTVTRIVAGGVARPKQCQKIRMPCNSDAPRVGKIHVMNLPKREDEKLQPSRSRNSCDVWQKFGRVVPEPAASLSGSGRSPREPVHASCRNDCATIGP